MSMMPCIPYLIVTIHTIQTIYTVISNIPCPTDLHTIPTIHTIPTTHAIHTIPTIHTKHTILSKHAIPDRPYTPYIPNIPYHTPTTPQGGEGDSATPPPHNRGGGGRSHMGPVYGTHPRGGRGGGRAWCIYIYIYIYIYILYYAIPSWKGRKWLYRNAVEFKHQRFGWTKTCVDWHSNFSPLIWLG